MSGSILSLTVLIETKIQKEEHSGWETPSSRQRSFNASFNTASTDDMSVVSQLTEDGTNSVVSALTEDDTKRTFCAPILVLSWKQQVKQAVTGKPVQNIAFTLSLQDHMQGFLIGRPIDLIQQGQVQGVANAGKSKRCLLRQRSLGRKQYRALLN